MGDGAWKLVVDRQGVTIASDRFQLRTNGHGTAQGLDDGMLEAAEPGQIEAVVSELQTMTWRTYGQFCGLAHALEIIGERWAMLIVRDLLVTTKTVDELHQGFPGMPIDILCTRLKELEHSGILRRRLRSRDHGEDSIAEYELTEHGRGLEAAAMELSRWGAQTLGEPRPGHVVTTESLIMALRSTFRPGEAAGLRAGFELRYGDIVIHARVDDGSLVAGSGPLPGADLVMNAGPVIRALMAGDITPAEAIEAGDIQLVGDPALLSVFVEVFHIPRLPSRTA